MSEPVLITDVNEYNLYACIRDSVHITKLLFTFSEEKDYRELQNSVNNYFLSYPYNLDTIQNILGVFSIVRPHNVQLLKNLESSLNLTHSSMKERYESTIFKSLPPIFTLRSPLIEIIKNDNISKLMLNATNNNSFDFSCQFSIKKSSEFVNLLDIAAYYGSVRCFYYLVGNRAPVSKNICAFAIAGGNFEIIDIIERKFSKQGFSEKICFDVAIAYHHYEISDWLMCKYNHRVSNIDLAIKTFNFLTFAFSMQIQKFKFSEKELFAAFESDNFPIARYLIENNFTGTLLGSFYKDGQNPLHVLAANNQCCFTRYLIEQLNVDKDVTDNYGRTPLHYACAKNSLSIVDFLCAMGANVEAVTSKEDGNRTALHIACENGNLDIVKFLCTNYNINKEKRTSSGKTALHIACEKDYADIVRYLCYEQQVNSDNIDNDGHLPINLTHNPEIIKILSSSYEISLMKEVPVFDELHFLSQTHEELFSSNVQCLYA